MTSSTRKRQRISLIRFWNATLPLLLLTCFGATSAASATHPLHSSNHAVIVSSSRYWFNYRHVVNALSIYQLCKSNGIPDENIILMLADELPTNARNPLKNSMTANGGRTNLYSDDIEIDYRGDEVTVDNLVRALLGKQDGNTTSTRTLHSNADSHVLVYWTGHGGDSFFKFQDIEEITAKQIARVFQQMHDMKRYKEILFIADTCQAFTLGDALGGVPNVYMVGSSLRGENSYAHHSDAILGLSVIERYTHALVQFLEKKDLKKLSLKQGLVDHLRFQEQRAHVGFRDDTCERSFQSVPMSDFFANVQSTLMKPMYKNHLASRIPWEVTPASGRPSLHQVRDDVENATCVLIEQEEVSSVYQGMEPSDPMFIAALLSFVGVVVLGSRCL